MANKDFDPELEFPIKTWQFWLVFVTTIIYFVDTFLQWFIFESAFESITSALLFLILGFEMYSRVRNKRSYMGQRFSVIFCLVLIALVAFIYASNLL